MTAQVLHDHRKPLLWRRPSTTSAFLVRGPVDVAWLKDSDLLWQTTGLGREEFVQRLLSTLVFGHTRHRWSVPGTPSERGRQYLIGLAGRHFSGMSLIEPQFVDEFELPRRHDDERSGWPDQAVIDQNTLLMIELTTEKGSTDPASSPTTSISLYTTIASGRSACCTSPRGWRSPHRNQCPTEPSTSRRVGGRRSAHRRHLGRLATGLGANPRSETWLVA